MRKCFLYLSVFLSVFFYCLNGRGQQQRIDSLEIIRLQQSIDSLKNLDEPVSEEELNEPSKMYDPLALTEGEKIILQKKKGITRIALGSLFLVIFTIAIWRIMKKKNKAPDRNLN